MTPAPDPTVLETLARLVVAAAKARGSTVATAESLTAGMIAATLAEVPGASAALAGGVISYSSAVKANVLGVEAKLLAERGSVDGEVARQMAQGARRVCGSDLAVSATGVAGPTPTTANPLERCSWGGPRRRAAVSPSTSFPGTGRRSAP